MPSTINSAESQSSLADPMTQQSSTGGVGLRSGISRLILDIVNDFAQTLVVRDVKVQALARGVLEPLLAAPRHVLEGGQRAVGHEQEIQVSVADEDVLGLVNDFWERAE